MWVCVGVGVCGVGGVWVWVCVGVGVWGRRGLGVGVGGCGGVGVWGAQHSHPVLSRTPGTTDTACVSSLGVR